MIDALKFEKAILNPFIKISKFFQINVFTFEPSNPIRCSWDIFLAFILLIDVFYTPLKATFLLEHDVQYTIFNPIILFLLFIDIIINLNTAYYSKGDYIKKKKKILQNYLKNNLFLDILIFAPFCIKEISQGSWLYFFRIIRFQQILKKVNQFLQFTQYAQAIIDLIKLILLIAYLAHLCGCAFYELAIFQIQLYDSKDTWLHVKDLIGKSWNSQYINSIYFAVVTMITVGYGDIYPQNNTERVFTIFIMICSWISFGFSLNSIGQILGELMKEGKILKYLKFYQK